MKTTGGKVTLNWIIIIGVSFSQHTWAKVWKRFIEVFGNIRVSKGVQLGLSGNCPWRRWDRIWVCKKERTLTNAYKMGTEVDWVFQAEGENTLSKEPEPYILRPMDLDALLNFFELSTFPFTEHLTITRRCAKFTRMISYCCPNYLQVLSISTSIVWWRKSGNLGRVSDMPTTSIQPVRVRVNSISLKPENLLAGNDDWNFSYPIRYKIGHKVFQPVLVIYSYLSLLSLYIHDYSWSAEGPLLNRIVRTAMWPGGPCGGHGKESGLCSCTGGGYLLTSDCVTQGKFRDLLSLNFSIHKTEWWGLNEWTYLKVSYRCYIAHSENTIHTNSCYHHHPHYHLW